MNKISLLVTLVLCCMMGYAQEKGAYLSFGGGLGASSFNYDLRGINQDGTNKSQLGWNGNIGFSYFFTPHWGIGTGVGISFYKSLGKYDQDLESATYYDLGTYTDNDYVEGIPRNFNLRARLANWEEKQTGYFLEIPLMVLYQFKFGEKKHHGMYFGLGAKVQFPLQSKYEVVDGKYSNDYRLNISAAYNGSTLELGGPDDPSLLQHGFGSIHDPNERYGWNGKQEIKPSIAGTAEIGFVFALNRRVELLLSGYIDYGFNNIKKESKNFIEGPLDKIVEKDENIAQEIMYNGMVNSNVTERVNLFSYGGKLSLRFKFGKLPESKPDIVQKPVILEVTDKIIIHDTVFIEKELLSPTVVDVLSSKNMDILTNEEYYILTEPIFFDLNSSKLRTLSKGLLDRKIQILQKYPDINIRILGNTCDLGYENINVPLGLHRAESAKRYLIEKGIAAKRIKTSSQSSHDPLMPNTNEENREINRRGDFEIIE